MTSTSPDLRLSGCRARDAGSPASGIPPGVAVGEGAAGSYSGPPPVRVVSHLLDGPPRFPAEPGWGFRTPEGVVQPPDSTRVGVSETCRGSPRTPPSHCGSRVTRVVTWTGVSERSDLPGGTGSGRRPGVRLSPPRVPEDGETRRHLSTPGLRRPGQGDPLSSADPSQTQDPRPGECQDLVLRSGCREGPRETND